MPAQKKKPSLAEVLKVLKKVHGSPILPERLDDPLIDHLMVAVLAVHVGAEKARDAVRALSVAGADFNEVRVSALSEIEESIKPFVPAEIRRQAAYDVRMALQDVWDGSHGLDLEPLRGRTPEDQRRFIKDMPNIHGGAASMVFQLALGDKALAFGPREEHLLRRLGMLPRATTPERVRKAVERKVKAKDRLEFVWLVGAASRTFEDDIDPTHPFCKLLVAVGAKELAVREQERKREEARLKAEEKQRKIEEEKQRRADERERKRVEKIEAKNRREAERKAKVEAAKQAAIAAKKAAIAEKKKAAAAKKKADAAIAKKKAAVAKKKAAVKKKAAAAKKKAAVAKKKAAAAKKKAAAAKKKAAVSKKKKTAKRRPVKKAVKKKTAKRRPVKKAVKKKTAKRKPAKAKKAVKKKTAKRRPVKKAVKKKTAKRRPVKKAVKKKTAKRKTSRAGRRK